MSGPIFEDGDDDLGLGGACLIIAGVVLGFVAVIWLVVFAATAAVKLALGL